MQWEDLIRTRSVVQLIQPPLSSPSRQVYVSLEPNLRIFEVTQSDFSSMLRFLHYAWQPPTIDLLPTLTYVHLLRAYRSLLENTHQLRQAEDAVKYHHQTMHPVHNWVLDQLCTFPDQPD